MKNALQRINFMVNWNDFAAKWLDTLLTSFAARPSLQARSWGWGWGKTGDSHFPPSQTPTNKEAHTLRWKKCSGCYSNETFLAEVFGCPILYHVLYMYLFSYSSYSKKTCTIYFFRTDSLAINKLWVNLKLSSFSEYDCSKSQSPLVFGIKPN